MRVRSAGPLTDDLVLRKASLPAKKVAAAQAPTGERAVVANYALAEIRGHLLATHVPEEVLAAEMAT